MPKIVESVGRSHIIIIAASLTLILLGTQTTAASSDIPDVSVPVRPAVVAVAPSVSPMPVAPHAFAAGSPVVPILPSPVAIAPSVRAQSALAAEPPVSTAETVSNASSTETPIRQSQTPEVVTESALVDANDSDNDTDNAEATSIESVEEPTELEATVYNAEYQSLGMVVPLPSRSVICVRCRCAVQLGNVVAHFNRKHSLRTWITQYNQQQQLADGMPQTHPEPLTDINLEVKLHAQGAALFNGNGVYGAPLKNPLPAISLLQVLLGFMCGFCPVEDFTSVAYFSGAVSTMVKHMRETHCGLDHSNYTTCHVQHLYKDQGHKVYFRVELPYTGPTVPSTITSEGDELFESFLNENPTFNQQFDPDATVGDSRVFSRFYDYVKWFDLVVDVAGADTNENRLLLNDWVNARTPTFNDEVAQHDYHLKLLVRCYFNYIQKAMNSGSRSFYRFRIDVMHHDTKEPTPTVGLKPLDVKSTNKYFDLWFKYIKMMMMAAAPSENAFDADDDLHKPYYAFGEAIFNGRNRDAAREFAVQISNIIRAMRANGSGFLTAERAFPVLHAYVF